MQKNRRAWLKWAVISGGIVICIVAVVILVTPVFVSDNFIRQKVTQLLEDRFHADFQIGNISFNWPNRIDISYLTIQDKDQNKEGQQTQIDDIHGTLKLFPLLSKKLVAKKILIREINYENRLLVKDFVTDKLSFKDGIVFAYVRCSVNEGPTAIKGTVDIRQKKPVFDITIDGKDIYITQDVPIISLLPIFRVKEGEIGGVLNLSGYIRGNGLGKEILNKELVTDMKLEIRDGYIRGNKLLSSIFEIIGEKNTYTFDSMEAVIQIKDAKIYIPKMDIQSPVMSISASGMSEFEGMLSYDAEVRFNKEHLGKDVEKIAGLLLKQNALPIEIRGTTKDPKVAVKLHKDSMEHLIKGLVNDFLDSRKEKHKKGKN